MYIINSRQKKQFRNKMLFGKKNICEIDILDS